MVMELMEGGELFELVRTKRRFTENEAVNFTKQVKLTQFQLLLKRWNSRSCVHVTKFISYIFCSLVILKRCEVKSEPNIFCIVMIKIMKGQV